MAPPSPGRVESRDPPGLGVQLLRGGGEGRGGAPLIRSWAARPWPGRCGCRGTLGAASAPTLALLALWAEAATPEPPE